MAKATEVKAPDRQTPCSFAIASHLGAIMRVCHANHMGKTNGMTLFTFGYEGLSIEQFIARLKRAGVQTVVDVRELPLSRKPGFSKSAFSRALRKAGIPYAHFPALGCPKPIRDRYRADGNWPAYVKAFSAYLAKQDEAVTELAGISAKARACLVCFEADFDRCHRSIVARAVAHSGGPRVVHLTLKGEIADAHGRLAA